MEKKNNLDWISWTMIGIFFTLLAIAGVFSYNSIDWDVLKKMEAAPIVLPTPVPGSLPPEIEQQINAAQRVEPTIKTNK